MTSQFADLAEENEKLKREKELLSSQLAQTKKRCDDMIAFLTRCFNVGPDQISRIVRQGGDGPVGVTAPGGGGGDGLKLKLFGVWLDEDRKSKKREREDKVGLTGPGPEEMRGFELPPHPPFKSSKVCN